MNYLQTGLFFKAFVGICCFFSKLTFLKNSFRKIISFANIRTVRTSVPTICKGYQPVAGVGFNLFLNLLLFKSAHMKFEHYDRNMPCLDKPLKPSYFF